MKKNDLMQIKSESNSKLTKKVVNSILDQGTTSEMESYMKDVVNHGCVSGIVGELIYYTDTIAFYNKYKKEIHQLLKEIMQDTGIYNPSKLFKTWDDEDPMVEDTNNQNLLAWFGYEETVMRILNTLDIEY